MRIEASQLSKKFLLNTIFKSFDYTFEYPNSYAILGANGSGKSTLLRILSGMQSPNKGEVVFFYNNTKIQNEHLFHYVSYCAPSMEIIEEMTLVEFLKFHFLFKPITNGYTIESLITLSGLEKYKNTTISNYSSGMKQRVKLIQAIFTNAPILLLDEPCTNLDQKGVQQYLDWLELVDNKLVIISSNDEREYANCNYKINIEDYK